MNNEQKVKKALSVIRSTGNRGIILDMVGVLEREIFRLDTLCDTQEARVEELLLEKEARELHPVVAGDVGSLPVKDIATEFFYHWHNAPGNNTAQGFDDWWEINKMRFIPIGGGI